MPEPRKVILTAEVRKHFTDLADSQAKQAILDLCDELDYLRQRHGIPVNYRCRDCDADDGLMHCPHCGDTVCYACCEDHADSPAHSDFDPEN